MAILLSNITARPYAGVQDLAAIAALINTCIVCDRLDGLSTVAALEHEYSSPDFDLVQDLRLWFDQSNTLGAVAECWLPKAPNEQRAYLTFWVKPTVRGQGIETEILAWAEQRLRTVAGDRQLPAVLQIMVRETQTDRLDLLKQQGFTLSRSIGWGDRWQNPSLTPNYQLATRCGLCNPLNWKRGSSYLTRVLLITGIFCP